MKPSDLSKRIESSSSLWKSAWENFASFDRQVVSCLIETLAKIPGSSSIDPPPVHLCKCAALLLLNPSKKASDDDTLKICELVQNFSTRLMQFEWEEPKEEVCSALTEILIQAEGSLRKQIKDHRQMAQTIMKLIEDLEKPWRIMEKRATEDENKDLDEHEELLDFSSWQKASVSWLSNPEFFTPSLLPTMKIPNSKSQGVYTNKDDYMNTIQRLWVGMTFTDGHSSLSPQCHHRSGKNGVFCQKTLWPLSSSKVSLRCRTPHCNGVPEFACSIKNHDALCVHCAKETQLKLRGRPGPKASTHIYDGRIGSIDTDGRLFLYNVQSRNPPQRDIHWRSTKRLSTPSLVGIVKINAIGKNLQGSDVIHWGEIVFHGNPRDESSRREKGEVAVNMASIIDFNHDEFNVNDQVCVIDCMTFVPEWIPVLQALQRQTRAAIPFNEGQYLNIWSGVPADISNSVVSHIAADDLDISGVPTLIQCMVKESNLDPIRAIRQDTTASEQLVSQLTKLVKDTTLDRMQMISFIDGLRNPVHLTQGPPGTILFFLLFINSKLMDLSETQVQFVFCNRYRKELSRRGPGKSSNGYT